jgi:hypothetical protein
LGTAATQTINALTELGAVSGVSIASATTTDIWTGASPFQTVTGSVTVTGFGNPASGNPIRILYFSGAPLLTNGANLICLSGANIQVEAGDIAIVRYEGSNVTRMLAYARASGRALVISPKSSFSAHKNGSNQTGVTTATEIAITFGTELYDLNSNYDTGASAWTPPSGPIMISSSLYFTVNVVDQSNYFIIVYKNGSAFKYGAAMQASGTGTLGVDITMFDNANGTDVYTIRAQGNGAGDKTIDGTASLSWFMGSQI